MVRGIQTRGGVLTLGVAPQVSRCKLGLTICKRDEDGSKTDRKVSVATDSGPKIEWFMLSNGGEPRQKVALS